MLQDLFADMLPEPRITEDVTSKWNDKLLSTSLWPAGPAWKDLSGIARPDLPTSEGETQNKARLKFSKCRCLLNPLFDIDDSSDDEKFIWRITYTFHVTFHVTC